MFGKNIDSIREKYIKLIAKYYWLSISIYILLIGFFAYHALNIGLKTDFLDLLPEKNKHVAELRKVIEYYGGEGYLIGVLEWKSDYQNILDSLKNSKKITSSYLEELNTSLNQEEIDWFTKKDGTNKLTYIIESYEQLKNNIIYYVPKNFTNTVFQTQILDKIKSSEQKDLILKLYSESENKKNRILKESVSDSQKQEIIGIFNAIGYKLDFIHSLSKQIEFIISDTKSKWEEFQKNPTDHEKGYDLAASLEGNVQDFDLDYKTINTEKGGKNKLIQAAEIAAPKLENQKDIIKYVEFKFRTSFIKDHLLYFLSIQDLQEIKDKLKNKIAYERRKKILSSSLFVDKPVSLDFKDIEDRNADSTKVLKVSKQTDFLDKSESEYDYYLNDNDDMLLLLIKPAQDSSNLGFSENLLNKSKNIANEILNSDHFSNELKIGFTGRYVKKVEDSQIISQDLGFVSVLAVVLILLFVFFTFRNLRSVCVIGLTLLSGLFWSVGLVEMTIGYFNIISGFLVAILSGLGVDFQVNLFNRYTEERARGRNVYESLNIIFKTTFLSNFTTTITIAAAFFTLTISDFKGFSQFGFTAGAGMLLLLFDVILAIPAIIIISEKIRPMKLSKKVESIKNIDNLKGKRLPYYRLIIFAAIAMTVFSFIGLKNVKFNSNFYDLAAQNTIGRNLEKKAEESVQTSLWPFVIYTKDWNTMKEVTKHINNLKDQGKLPSLYKVDSISNYLPTEQEEKKAVMIEIKEQLRDSILSKLKNEDEKKKVNRLKTLVDAPFIKDIKEVPYELTRQFVGNVPGYFIFYYPHMNRSMSDSQSLKEMAGEIQSVYDTAPAHIDRSNIIISSDAMVFNDVMDLIVKEAPIIFGLLIFAMLFFMWLDSRKWRTIAITLVPLGIGFFWIFGVSFAAGWSFNFFNVMMLPIIMGISINYGVHLVHRIKEDGKANILFIFKTTGMSVYMGALTDLVGFGSLIFALYKGLATMGQLSLAGILCCATAGSFLMLAIYEMRKDVQQYGWKKAFFGKIPKE